MNENIISPLLKSAAVDDANDCQFITFDQVTVWIRSYEYSSPHRINGKTKNSD
jgi:hypothetical protein